MSEVKKQMTDQERLELAAKLDRELDDFIDGLEKRRYTEGWPEDRWEEEMDKHPFFMKQAPQEGDELHPLMEGMQQLKYDPEENTAEELANTYKEDGNFYVKHKKYRMAILSYTEGLKQKFNNDKLKSTLHNNRSAANYFLQNYRSAYYDAKKALDLDPSYLKAHIRLGQSAFHMNQFDECTEICNRILLNNPNNEVIKQLLIDNHAKKTKVERENRKRLAQEKKIQNEFNKVSQVLKTRKVKFEEHCLKYGLSDTSEKLSMEVIKPKLAPLEDNPVHIDENNGLVWPICFSYPEFLHTDFHKGVEETTIFSDVLSQMMDEALPPEMQKSYNIENVSVYYENHFAARTHKINCAKTIRQIVEQPSFYVTGGVLCFFVVPSNSDCEQKYLNEKRIPLKVGI